MAIVEIRIHPAIGFARLGDSPDEFFIGPEKPGEIPAPPGGFKDAQCRIKRQAARFRLWGYDAMGNPEREVTAADGAIQWTVRLANRKAKAQEFTSGLSPAALRNPGVTGADRDGLAITPPAASLNGPLQQASLDGVFTLPGLPAEAVHLGDVRTDNEGRLLVLGGHGLSGSPDGSPLPEFANNDGWYDDISDGPVSATVTLTGAAAPTPVAGAWVVVGPPKYAPEVPNVVTLWESLFHRFVVWGTLAAPVTPSFTKHIYPLVKAAMDSKGVSANLFGTAPSPAVVSALTIPVPPAQRQDFFDLFKNPAGGGGAEPRLQDGPMDPATLAPTAAHHRTCISPTLYQLLTQWKDDDGTNPVINDWTGLPAGVTPEGLDQAALMNAAGGPLFPGMEAGAILFKDPALWSAPWRLSHAAVAAGQVTEQMALPWQADFHDCDTGWWPAVRPNRVKVLPGAAYEDWRHGVTTHAAMVADWHTLGFVARQGADLLEVERCGEAYVTLLTPALNFLDVPQGPAGSRLLYLPVEFEILSTGGPISLDYLSGPAHARITRVTPGPLSAGPTPAGAPERRLFWIAYETGAPGEVLTDTVTFRNTATGRTWTVAVTANTVARQTTAVALVLDRSGSMTQDQGDGVTLKIDALRASARHFLTLLLQGDGLSLVRYNHDAQRLTNVETLGDGGGGDAARTAALTTINGPDLNPSGSTSIGDGMIEGMAALGTAAGFGRNVLVVMTDGKENTSQWISGAAPLVTAGMYAIGLGTPENTSAAALQALSGNRGGYTLITGPIAGDNEFRLSKFFLQIAAGINGAEIVLDPDGVLVPGRVERIPFEFCEADKGAEVVLLAPSVKGIEFLLETPSGQIISPATAGVWFIEKGDMAFYRFGLPVVITPGRPQQQGGWHAILRYQAGAGGGRDERAMTHGHDLYQGNKGMRYSLLVHAYSGIRLETESIQDRFEPGAAVRLGAQAGVHGAPLLRDLRGWAEISAPGFTQRIELKPGRQGALTADWSPKKPGTYQVRMRIQAKSPEGWKVHRESTRTVAVWHGGDTPPSRTESQESGKPLTCWQRLRRRLIRWLRCLFGLA